MSKRFQTVLASAARTASPTAQRVDTGFARDLLLIVDVSAVTLTPSITITVSGVDPLSGNTYPILVSAAITTVSTNVLQVSPTLASVANTDEGALLPLEVEVSVAHGDADSITYSISAVAS